MPRNYCPYELTAYTPGEYEEFFCQYLLEHHQDGVREILAAETVDRPYSLSTSFAGILEAHQQMAALLLAHPQELFPLFDSALVKAQESVQGDGGSGVVKKNVHVRLASLQSCPELCLTARLPLSSDVGRFLEVQGTAIRTGHPRIMESKRTYMCTECGTEFSVEPLVETGFQFELPSACPNTEVECSGTAKHFVLVGGLRHYRDVQEIRIQEQVHKVGVGSIPKQVSVVLFDDLVDRCQAGDTVVVVGEVRTRWRREAPGERPEIETVIVANNAHTDNDNRRSSAITDDLRADFAAFWRAHAARPLAGRDFVLRSVCPTIYGLHTVKLAVALVLIGGVSRTHSSGMRTRGQCHLLLVGEPGTGKSQFLKFASQLGPRHVLATGGGTSSAGLTVAAIKEPGGEWVLEAGALVLADGGVCCIDEFSTIKHQDRCVIHEAMEQQTISVAKASICCRLHTRTAVLAATNAKGKYDPTQPISMNVALDSPLLSRFDMVLLLLDTQNTEWDQLVASFILSGRSLETSEQYWDLERLQSYLSYVKTSVKPSLDSNAELILGEYFRRQRKSDYAESARTTVRLLESLIRIAEAHARLMARDTVCSQDAIVAIMLVQSSLNADTLSGTAQLSALHHDFSPDPDKEYREREAEILRTLGLQDRVPPFDPSTAHMHDFAEKPSQDVGDDDDGQDNEEEEEEEGPFRAGENMRAQEGFVPDIGDDDGEYDL